MSKQINYIYRMFTVIGTIQEVIFNGEITQCNPAVEALPMDEFNVLLMGSAVIYQNVEYRYRSLEFKGKPNYASGTTCIVTLAEVVSPTTVIELLDTPHGCGIVSANVQSKKYRGSVLGSF